MSKIFSITSDVFTSLIEQKVSLDHLFLLEQVYMGEKIGNGNPRWNSIVQGMKRKGFISDNGLITVIGKDLYEGLCTGCKNIKVKKPAIDKEGISQLHGKLRDLIFSLTNKKQVRVNFNGTSYSFLPNETDLINRLVKVITKYKLTDYGRVEKALLDYVKKCHRKNNWLPLLGYYIMKDEQSRLATDYDSLEEKEDSETNRNTMLI